MKFISLIILFFSSILSFSGQSKNTTPKTSTVVKVDPLKSKKESQMKNVSLGTLFPTMTGKIRDYEISIPKNFELGSDPADNKVGYLWGTKSDLANWQDIPKVEEGLLRFRFTPNVAPNSQGKIPGLDKAAQEKSGAEQYQEKSGNFKGIQGVPVTYFKARVKGSLLYMLYIYSPTDNLVILANLQGAKDPKKADLIWDEFVKGFEVK